MHSARLLAFTTLLAVLTSIPFALARADDKNSYRYSIDWTSANELVWTSALKRFVGKANVHGLEVGCFEGRSTIWFLEKILTHSSTTMTCIDVFTDQIEADFDHNIKTSGLGDRVLKRKGFSQHVLRGLEYDAYDFIYIDGCHLASCALTDMVLSWDLLRSGGVMIIDDYSWQLGRPPSERPKIAVDAFIEAFTKKLQVRRLGRQVVLVKKGARTREDLVGKPVVHDDEWHEKQGGKAAKSLSQNPSTESAE